METAVLYKMIDEIDWSQYETAYGNAAQDIPHFQVGKTPSVPSSLWALFSGDRERAMQAASSLWAGLCHQHTYVSSAALPACDVLMLGLQELDDELKVELLDIFLGFAACTGRSAETDWNFYSKKSKKIVSSIIIILLVLAMIVPTIASFLY